MIVRAHDAAFRVTLASDSRKTIKFRLRFRRSGGEPPVGIEPATYALRGPPTPPLPSLPAALLQHGSLGDAPAASLDAGSRPNPCHDIPSNDGWTSASSVADWASRGSSAWIMFGSRFPAYQ